MTPAYLNVSASSLDQEDYLHHSSIFSSNNYQAASSCSYIITRNFFDSASNQDQSEIYRQEIQQPQFQQDLVRKSVYPLHIFYFLFLKKQKNLLKSVLNMNVYIDLFFIYDPIHKTFSICFIRMITWLVHMVDHLIWRMRVMTMDSSSLHGKRRKNMKTRRAVIAKSSVCPQR